MYYKIQHFYFNKRKNKSEKDGTTAVERKQRNDKAPIHIKGVGDNIIAAAEGNQATNFQKLLETINKGIILELQFNTNNTKKKERSSAAAEEITKREGKEEEKK